jgi:hypothetical protein
MSIATMAFWPLDIEESWEKAADGWAVRKEG